MQVGAQSFFGSAISAEETKCVEAISESWKEAWAEVFVTPEYHLCLLNLSPMLAEHKGHHIINIFGRHWFGHEVSSSEAL